ncbi:MAG: hypothetical protein ACKVJK_02020 [Methylophagaceae bacterium]|jgi:hypothetical protein|tara:strand:- start:170 stop:403 length:234 start_codon:yes stop_codon:yes gene_type:complete
MAIDFNKQAYDKVFRDLENFKDFCRYVGDAKNVAFHFNEKDLYNERSYQWRSYQRHVNHLKSKTRSSGKNFNNKRRF